MELSIDTSTDWGGIGLSDEGRLLAEISWKPGHNHSVELHPNLRRLLETAGTDFKALTAVFVAIGPGSFNGLRAGISAAKGVAFSRAVPIAGIPTLEIEAYQFAGSNLPLCPIHDAGRGEIAVAMYSAGSSWECLQAEHLSTVDKLCAEIKTRTLFCGEIPEYVICRIVDLLGDKALIPGWAQRLRRPACLAELGWRRLSLGKMDSLASLQPIYLRQPPITQRKKRY